MKYQVVDSGFKIGEERNIMYATNNRQKAIIAAKESGEGILVIETDDSDKSEMVIFVSAYKEEIGLPE